MQNSRRFDVTSIGEAMLRLSVPAGARMDDARSLDVEVGGAESNVCVALARLERRCGWVSRLPDNALGSLVLRTLRSDGVEVSAVRRASNERVGTYFVELAAPPRTIQVIYDRADSAAARMTTADVDWDYLLDTRILHLTGITAALGANGYEIVAEAIRRARAANVTVSFDINYRSKLWDAMTAGGKLRPLMAQADILFCKSSDAVKLFGCQGTPRELTAGLEALTRAQAVYCTFGAQGAAVLRGDEFLHQPALAVQIMDRIGSGDAFAAGVLDAMLDSDPMTFSATDARAGLRRGVALAAIALSQFGDRVLASRTELEAVMSQDARDVAR